MLKREGERRQKAVDERAEAENTLKARGLVQTLGKDVYDVAYNDKGMQSTTKHIN
jgi:hypothetical protein